MVWALAKLLCDGLGEGFLRLPARYVHPFFFGFWRDMMLELMIRSTGSLRFAIQPTGGGLMNPAWGFAILIADCQPLAQNNFKARAVFKRS